MVKTLMACLVKWRKDKDKPAVAYSLFKKLFLGLAKAMMGTHMHTHLNKKWTKTVYTNTLILNSKTMKKREIIKLKIRGREGYILPTKEWIILGYYITSHGHLVIDVKTFEV